MFSNENPGDGKNEVYYRPDGTLYKDREAWLKDHKDIILHTVDDDGIVRPDFPLLDWIHSHFP
ncbi:hypothetical protein RBSH_02058 [Rhodopirellula baltica SH28]|uniref:Uncharacterized protein n=2 Tax=Rhodopirellula baltica TaxID=265606 RepID=K5E9Y6_RHOBT|nr:hypothetical protein RBSH_02058 [Rhodopirellula baltica SH28]